jgi:hypothetical protein
MKNKKSILLIIFFVTVTFALFTGNWQIKAQGIAYQSCVMSGRYNKNSEAIGYGCIQASQKTNENLCTYYASKVQDQTLSKYVTSDQTCNQLGFLTSPQITADGAMYYCLVKGFQTYTLCSPAQIQNLKKIIGY